jgi:thermitase
LRISAGFLILSTALFGGRYFPSESGDVVIPDEVIVRLKPKGNPYAVVSIIPGAQVKGSGKLDMHVLKTNGAAPAERLEALAAHPLVEFVEPNRVRKTQISAPNDPLYGDQGALNVIRAVGAWQLMPGAWSYAGTRIKVAVLDTGTDCTHPDFKGSGGSTDSATGGQLNFAKSAAPVATLATNSGCAWQDDHGHGTHVAGTIAAATQNSAGVASLGYPLEILTYKVLSSQGSGDDMTIANAITAATDAGANVVSLSLGASGYSQALQTAVDYAWARNTLIIAAAGNSGSNTLFFPASAHHAISVAATDGYTRAGFSNYGPSIAIAAPGVSILSTALRTTGYSYVRMSGTSMATPHVSALAGLIGMTTPGVATESIVQRIQQSATGNSGWTQMLGYGVINAQAAVAGTLVSSAPGSITGQVVDGSSLPVGGAVVSVAGQTFTTGAYGLFRIANIPPGSHVLTFSGPQQPSRTMNVGVAPGADTPLLLLTGVPTGLVHGIVTSAGQAVPGAVVYAMSNGLRVASTVAATDGRYQLELRTGTYEMRASAIGYRNGSPVPASVSASTEVPADLSLVRYGQIRGTARDTGGKIVSAAEAVASGPQMAGSVAAGDGTFSTIGLPAGQYTMRCSAPGYRAPDPLSISVTDGTATAADCVFAVPTITINPPTSVVNAGAQLQLTALADGIATSTVTWALDSPTGAITNTGLYTAPAASTVARTVKVTATSRDPDRFCDFRQSRHDHRGILEIGVRHGGLQHREQYHQLSRICEHHQYRDYAIHVVAVHGRFPCASEGLARYGSDRVLLERGDNHENRSGV